MAETTVTPNSSKKVILNGRDDDRLVVVRKPLTCKEADVIQERLLTFFIQCVEDCDYQPLEIIPSEKIGIPLLS